MVRETEIVVGAETKDATPVDFDLGSLWAGNPQGPTKEAGGF
jgi:hypothetical protein